MTDDRDPDFKVVSDTVLIRLKQLSMTLQPQFEAAQNGGDQARADAIDRVLSRIGALRIHIAQAIVRFLDDAPDVAAALARIDEVNGRLQAAADQSEQAAADLGKVTDVLDGLAKLAGSIADA